MTFFAGDNDSVQFEAVLHNYHEALEILLDVDADYSTVNYSDHNVLPHGGNMR
jgi:hypothetical protein